MNLNAASYTYPNILPFTEVDFFWICNCLRDEWNVPAPLKDFGKGTKGHSGIV